MPAVRLRTAHRAPEKIAVLRIAAAFKKANRALRLDLDHF
jgi:hypothetical protein